MVADLAQCDSGRDEALNSALYDSLYQIFGYVSKENAGIEATVQRSGGNIEVTGGEYYRVNCPMCGDRRRRLYVNHLFGTSDKVSGKQLNHLFVCFNEHCEKRGLDLVMLMQGYLSKYSAIPPIIKKGKPNVERGFCSPGYCEPLKSLPLSHPARSFFLKRNFNPDFISEAYGISVCVEPSNAWSVPVQNLLHGRIILPVTRDNQLIGWQARYLDAYGNGTPPNKGCPKYFTMPGFHKSKHLMNYDLAATMARQSGIVVEGYMDAMRLTGAVACFGHTLSTVQKDMLQKLYGDGALVILFDRDAIPDAEKLQREMFTSFKHGVVCVHMPDERDPADWNSNELMNFISQQAVAQGVELGFSFV